MLQQIYPSPQHDYPMELHKEFDFCAAHNLPDPSASPCDQLHGHTYFVDLCIVGHDVDNLGMLVNFRDLKKLIHDRFDHQCINSIPFQSHLAKRLGEMPSTEVLAHEIWWIVQKYLDTLPNNPLCLQVFLRETPTAYCIYRPTHSMFGKQ